MSRRIWRDLVSGELPAHPQVVLRSCQPGQKRTIGLGCGENGLHRFLDLFDKPTRAKDAHRRGRQQEKGRGIQRLNREKSDQRHRSDARAKPGRRPESEEAHDGHTGFFASSSTT